MKRTIRRLMRTQLAAAWRAWVKEQSIASRLRDEKARAAGIMRRSMCRMLAAQLSAGWGAWVTMLLEQRHMEAEHPSCDNGRQRAKGVRGLQSTLSLLGTDVSERTRCLLPPAGTLGIRRDFRRIDGPLQDTKINLLAASTREKF